jgi:AcrR family transcriptional regulator
VRRTIDGFEAASYAQIAREMGLSKPSLYNTFGDKLSLFQRVVDDYSIRASKQIFDSFSRQDTLEQGVANLLRSAATFYSQPKGPSHGCLLVGTALPACTQYDGIRETLARFTHSLDQLLEQVIDTQYAHDAQACGMPSR